MARTRSSAASTTDRLEWLRITKRKIFAPAARSQFLKGTVFGAVFALYLLLGQIHCIIHVFQRAVLCICHLGICCLDGQVDGAEVDINHCLTTGSAPWDSCNTLLLLELLEPQRAALLALAVRRRRLDAVLSLGF